MDMPEKKHCTAIILSAGRGKRMEVPVEKQYIELQGKPIIYYTLKQFQESEIIEDIVLVVGEQQKDYVSDEIVGKYGFDKVRAVVCGGRERYDSVWNGLQAIRTYDLGRKGDENYVFIHDGVRMFVDGEMLKRGYENVIKYKACAAAIASKDTVALIDDGSFAVQTPERKYIRLMQTPQVFEQSLVTEAYSRLMQNKVFSLTDDSSVVEKMMKMPVKLFEGSNWNIKITTKDDLLAAEAFLKHL